MCVCVYYYIICLLHTAMSTAEVQLDTVSNNVEISTSATLTPLDSIVGLEGVTIASVGSVVEGMTGQATSVSMAISEGTTTSSSESVGTSVNSVTSGAVVSATESLSKGVCVCVCVCVCSNFFSWELVVWRF